MTETEKLLHRVRDWVERTGVHVAAERSGVHVNTVRNVARGQAPTTRTLQRLEEAMSDGKAA